MARTVLFSFSCNVGDVDTYQTDIDHTVVYCPDPGGMLVAYPYPYFPVMDITCEGGLFEDWACEGPFTFTEHAETGAMLPEIDPISLGSLLSACILVLAVGFAGRTIIRASRG